MGGPPTAHGMLPAELESSQFLQHEPVKDGIGEKVGSPLTPYMPPAELRRMVELLAGRARLEASGNITLETSLD